MESVPDLGLIALALIALLLSAVLTAGEAALTRVTRSHAVELASAHKPRAGSVEWLAERRDSAILGTGFVRVLAEMTAAVATTLVISTLFDHWWAVMAVAVVVLAFVLALISGTSPRHYGRRHPAHVTHALAPILVPLERLGRMLRAFVAFLSPASDRTSREQIEDSAEEMRDMVELVSESEHLEDDEREMLHSVFELGRTITREVMLPRTEMVTIDADTTLDKALRLFVRSGFSRIPVIGDGDVEDIRGIVYLKDVLRRVENPQAEHDETHTRVEHVARRAQFVPETMLVDDLLEKMQQRSFHMAMVIDEYGGVAGLVTMEDVLEELVGDMTDEHDRAEPEVEELGAGWWRVPARLGVDDLGEIFDLPIDDDDVDSVGGLLTKALGRVPIEGTSATVQGLYLQAERAGGRRHQIQTVLARALTEDDDE
ncbi:MAG: hemolysin family protein [Bowdeniella nasicola]|nr:hemolysin family protein [Bowdeniella nasicola]